MPSVPFETAEPEGLPSESVIDFIADTDELVELRDHTQAVLDRWELTPVGQVACLLVTELATNAIVHTGQPARLRLTHDQTLRIAVTDTDPTPPTFREPNLHDPNGGWGLIMLSRLSDHWDYVQNDEGGKTVLCELRPD